MNAAIRRALSRPPTPTKELIGKSERAIAQRKNTPRKIRPPKMTPEEYLSYVRNTLKLTYSGRGNVWMDRDNRPHHVPDPYALAFDERKGILEDIKKG